ncbi:hypothetical protein QQS21_009193 [Conoideocrella luteorostrata]|uniref:Alpha-galactosidase n=1 Tax=Conoideocrella luteorostrata TaxID=1105319 RepID=A0AAJ0CJR0_9HYPO|nr:hypothetical protein QQS21_009193 [Conoideocrella luteorostrata]
MGILTHTFIALSCAACLATSSAFQSTPVMGWNSYNLMACSPHDQGLRATINALADRGFVKAGYNLFQVDCGWASRDGQRNATTGALKVNPDWFPNGLEPLSDLARSKGMQWAMYSDAGARMCDTQVPGPVLGSLGYEAVDADFFKMLNTTYLKCMAASMGSDKYVSANLNADDNCYADGPDSNQSSPKDPRTDFVSRFTTMWNELQRVGISGMLVCQWGVPFSTSNGLQGPAQWTKGLSTSFRLSDDIAKGWGNVYRIYNQAIHVARSGVISPGNTADADLLEVGNDGMTFDEQASHFAAWAMLKSALMISTNISALSDVTIAVLQNKDLIAINQDPAVKPIRLVQRWTGNRDLWAGDLANGDLAVFCMDLSNARRTLTIQLSELGLASATIKDLWTGKTMSNTGSYSKQINGHGSLALRLSNIRRACTSPPKYTYVSVATGYLSSGASLQPCSGCTSSHKVGNLGGSSGGKVVLSNIRTSKASQTVKVDYVNGEVGYLGGSNNERLASIRVNGGPGQTVSFPLSGYNWDKDVCKGYAVVLSGFNTEKPNTIDISGVGIAWAPDFDRVGLVA